jgi:4-hydroxybenzoate polyprenyltransferase
MLNTVALLLSPVALAILLGYSVTKRYTPGTHFFLGLALGIAPVGAWVGVRGDLSFVPILLGMGVICWAAGFDIIYSCQDEAVDRKLGLNSLPARFGRRRALAISALCHASAVILFLAVAWVSPLGPFYLAALCVCAWLLAYEQSLVTPDDLSRLGRAFFTLNGWISVLMFMGGALDLALAF